jgi:hypothetical protein
MVTPATVEAMAIAAFFPKVILMDSVLSIGGREVSRPRVAWTDYRKTA